MEHAHAFGVVVPRHRAGGTDSGPRPGRSLRRVNPLACRWECPVSPGCRHARTRKTTRRNRQVRGTALAPPTTTETAALDTEPDSPAQLSTAGAERSGTCVGERRPQTAATGW